jgi:MFS transporter, MHS family, proline/betaine transporter
MQQIIHSGTLLGGIVGFILRQSLSKEDLIEWGWRIPFIMGIFVSIAGLYLQFYDDDDHLGHHNVIPLSDPVFPHHNDQSASDHSDSNHDYDENDADLHVEVIRTRTTNAFLRAIEPQNFRSLVAASMVPVLWSAGFYLAFVWMAIFMTEFIEKPVPGSFGVNSAALLFSVCLFFPISGILSDKFGRLIIMKIGGVCIGLFGPFMLMIIGKGHALSAFFAQCVLGIGLSLWGGPMCAWLVESFEPHARLTSVSIGYNLAHALVGAVVPSFATWLVDNVHVFAPGIIFSFLAMTSLIGLVYVAPSPPGLEAYPTTQHRSVTSPMKMYPYNEVEMSSPPHGIDNKNDDLKTDELV